jgi:hypothetical protein
MGGGVWRPDWRVDPPATLRRRPLLERHLPLQGRIKVAQSPGVSAGTLRAASSGLIPGGGR